MEIPNSQYAESGDEWYGWEGHKEQEQGWIDMKESLEYAHRFGNSQAGHVLSNLYRPVLIDGVERIFWKFGAHPKDAWECSGLHDMVHEFGETEEVDPYVKMLVENWMTVLETYPPPRFVSRSMPGPWSRSVGLGFNHPREVDSEWPVWLSSQAIAFGVLIDHCDKLRADNLEVKIIPMVDALTEPGGAFVERGNDALRASIGGPGANPQDVMDLCQRHGVDELQELYPSLTPLYQAYIESLYNDQVPYECASTSPGRHAQELVGWTEP